LKGYKQFGFINRAFIMPVSSRLQTAKEFFADLLKNTDLPLDIRLWDHSLVEGPASSDSPKPCVALTDEGTMSAVLRKPYLNTVIDLYVAGRLVLEQGSFEDIMALHFSRRGRDLFRKLDKKTLAKTLFQFLPVSPHQGKTLDPKPRISADYAPYSFFTNMLGPRLITTCCVWGEDIHTLEQAETAKLEQVFQKLRLDDTQRVFDVACGWGSLIRYLAQEKDIHVQGATRSENQYLHNRDMIAREDISRKANVTLGDEENMTGYVDAISCLGVFERLPPNTRLDFLKRLNSRLPERGLMLMEVSTRRAKSITNARKRRRPRQEYKSLIRYALGKGALTDIGTVLQYLEASGFEVHDVENMREHFALTTNAWRKRLEDNVENTIRTGGAPNWRLWHAYMTGLTRAFDQATLGCYQVLASKRSRGPSGLPLKRSI
jgi:cyclopropane-fatty-acyl-phospholipid synthase